MENQAAMIVFKEMVLAEATLCGKPLNWRALANDLEIEQNYKLGKDAMRSLIKSRVRNAEASH